MSRGRAQILLLPGLGGDHRMCSMLLPIDADAVTPDYIAWRKNESLDQYAKRYLEHLVARQVTDPTRLRYIAGISLGGPIGIEISRILGSRVKALVLIGSFISTEELAPYVRAFVTYLAPLLPELLYRAAGHVLPFFMRRISRVPEDSLDLLQDMYLNVPRRFFARACRGLAGWEKVILANSHTTIVRVHGEDDHIIPANRITPTLQCDSVIIRGAKHLVSFSHTDLVRAGINSVIRSADAGNDEMARPLD